MFVLERLPKFERLTARETLSSWTGKANCYMFEVSTILIAMITTSIRKTTHSLLTTSVLVLASFPIWDHPRLHAILPKGRRDSNIFRARGSRLRERLQSEGWRRPMFGIQGMDHVMESQRLQNRASRWRNARPNSSHFQRWFRFN